MIQFCDRCGIKYWSVRQDCMCARCFNGAVKALQHDNELKQVAR